MRPVESEQEYGCVRCQEWHGESDGPIYAEHLMWQSKHGMRRRPIGGWSKSSPPKSPRAAAAGD